MRILSTVVCVAALTGCAHSQTSEGAGGFLPYSVPSISADYIGAEQFKVASSERPIRISGDAMKPCDARYAKKPRLGNITQEMWQFINRDNEDTIRNCAAKHMNLINEVKSAQNSARGDK